MTHVQLDMEPCHSVVTSRSPAITSAATVAHLIRNIEQLKNKDKLISQLEKDLGHQWTAACALERNQSEGAEAMASGTPSLLPGALPEGRPDPDSFSWTLTSIPSLRDVEEERSTGDEGVVCGNQNMPKKLRERNKLLTEKCRAYLQRTKELTAQNRAFKDISEKALQENKKLQELVEHSKLRLLQVSRQVNELKTDRTNVDKQTENVEEMRKEMTEDKKTITALRQACSEKDRRIELIQHRKKRRRMIGSVEKNMGVRETFFGYEEDNQSVESENNSNSSLSFSTVSEDDLWDDVLSREETERNYQRLATEQLQLQKSYALLQSQMGMLHDPEREALSRSHVQQDLFQAQCRIEQLEQLVSEIGEQGEVVSLLKEREAILGQNKAFYERIQHLEKDKRRLCKDLSASQDKFEELEFRLVELEHLDDESKGSSVCEASPDECCLEPGKQELVEQIADTNRQKVAEEMEQIRKELTALLKGNREADGVLMKWDRMRDMEKQNSEAMEMMAHELQKKIISLQKENDSLTDELAVTGTKSVLGFGEVAAQERQENLELKVEIDRLFRSETHLVDERNALQDQLDDQHVLCESLKQQLDIFTRGQQNYLHVKVHETSSSGDSAPESSPSQSPKRSSKDRKSKSRSDDDSTPQLKRRKSGKGEADSPVFNSFRSVNDVKAVNEEKIECTISKLVKSIVPSVKTHNKGEDKMIKRITNLETEIKDIKKENSNLMDQLKQSSIEKSSEAEADQQMLLDRMRAMDSELDLLRRENETLAKQLHKRRQEQLNDSQEDISPRLSELEEYCEDLQERLQTAEATERHLKEKLRLLESNIYDAESSEIATREEYDKLVAREAETKNHIVALQKTGRELRDIILDKDMVEHALRDKVDFLHKAEAASVQRIEELEAVERDLREQLEQSSGEGSSSQRDLNKIQELKHQLTFLETDNKALSARVSELEENEEILRENWRRVADEDYNRTQCLEEKVKMLETYNRELKSKLSDAQEYFVINTVPSADTSWAAELAQSQNGAPSSHPVTGTGDINNAGDEGSDDDTEDASQLKSHQKVLKDKVYKLERKLSVVHENKNSKIEQLQETIIGLKENEIKLSETISEMEMTEREIRAKLALYESSEVTVEKMLKYQSKIEELRTSQESLLDQLESYENQEMTMQDRMQEIERTLRGKIVTLEVEMKSCKQKELKAAGKIRELEKQEKELTEKVAQQAEKENGLYVKISTLKDEIKAAKEENENMKTQLTEKEDKVRKSKLLEVKLLEIEMEFGKKTSDLRSKLRHTEEELRQREVAHEEEIKAMRQEVSLKASEQDERIFDLEELFHEKENEMKDTMTSLEDSLKAISCERDEYETSVRELKDENISLKESERGYEKELYVLSQEVHSIKSTGEVSEAQMMQMKEDLIKESDRVVQAETRAMDLEDQLEKEKQNVTDMEKKMSAMKDDISEKLLNGKNINFEKEQEYEKEINSLKNELILKCSAMSEVEKELNALNQNVLELEAECKKVKQEATAQENSVQQRISVLDQSMSDKEKALTELKEAHDDELNSLNEACDQYAEELSLARKMNDEQKDHINTMKSEKEVLEKDLRNKLMFFKSQLLKEAETREAQQTSLEEHVGKETSLSVEVEDLNKEVSQHKYELMDKISKLELKNKENCDLSCELSQSRHSLKTLQNEHEIARQNWNKTQNSLQKQLQERDQALEISNNDIKNVQIKYSEVESKLVEKETSLGEIESTKDLMQQRLVEKEKLVEEKCQKEIVIQEQMQKSESLLQERGREKQESEAQLSKIEKESKQQQIQNEHLEENISVLESKLAQSEENLKLQCREIEERAETKKLNETKVKELQQQLESTLQEVAENEAAHTSSHSHFKSQISRKQQELVHAQEELQKCLHDIEQCKTECNEKEKELKQQDLTFKELLAEKQELNLQLVQRDDETKSVETQMTNVQNQLVEAENRYRELEAKCASLEFQLEERYASAQNAEEIKLTKVKEIEELQERNRLLEEEIELKKEKLQESENGCGRLESRVAEIEKLLSDKDTECECLKINLKDCSLERDDALSTVEQLEGLKRQLQSDKLLLQEELEDASTEFENLRRDFEEGKSTLEGNMSAETEEKIRLEADFRSLHTSFEEKCLVFEENLEKQKFIEQKATVLQKELDEINVSHKCLECELELLKQIQKDHDETVSASKDQIKNLESAVESSNSEKEAEILKCKSLIAENQNLLKNMSELKETNRQAQARIVVLSNEISSLNIEKVENESQLSASHGNLSPPIVEDEVVVRKVGSSMTSASNQNLSNNKNEVSENVVDDADISVSFIDSGDCAKEETDTNDNKVLTLPSVESEKKIESLISEISSYKYRDDLYQAKLLTLKHSVQEIEDRESDLLARVYLLELKEKELLEQMADIEQTVIVPLECENQELKDELCVVKQERDETRRIEDGEEDMESVRKSLEDALLNREELEKKLDILSQEILCFENEREVLFKKVSDLESVKSENEEKLEGLQVEVERLQSLELQETVVEEAENRLMDRVLELEEREQSLLAEVDSLQKAQEKRKTTDGILQDKVKYLQEKNELLQDAEGKYMDNVMELEEVQHRLHSELSVYKLNETVEKNTVPSETESLSQSNSAISQVSLTHVSVDTSDLLSYSEHSSPSSEITQQVKSLQLENEKLQSDVDDKHSKIDSIQEKLVLLQDSESRLMEKLLEAEAQSESISARNSATQKKNETLIEENEYLAENVENYKQLYKDEKEKVVVLHDKLDDFKETQTELESTQNAVEELQSEYEAKLIDHEQKVQVILKQNENLQRKIESHNQMEEDIRAQEKLRRQELQGKIDALTQRREELRLQHKEREQKLQTELDTVLQREQTVNKTWDGKTLELQELRQFMAAQERNKEEHQFDSGISADGTDNAGGAFLNQELRVSTAHVVLSRPAPSPTPSPVPTVKTLSIANAGQVALSGPVAPPRSRSKSRSSSIDSIIYEDLAFLVEDLQERETTLKERVAELEAVNQSLERRAEFSERQTEFLARDCRDGESRLRGLRVHRRLDDLAEEEKRDALNQSTDLDQSRELDRSFSSAVSVSSSGNMLDKPEDVLQQRIKELERLDGHNKDQLSEIERDREVLHEIARKDKTTIHDLNVKLRELQLAERSLKEQVASLEASEISLYTKNGDLEATKSKHEDRIHELEIHERRLRELVRRLKLDEEQWLSKTGGMETAVAELSANEHQLKRLLQDVELQHGGLTEQSEYLDARIRELENVEVTLLQRIKAYENNEVTLQNRLVHLENSEAASHSKASELDVINMDLSHRLQRAIEENAVISQHVTVLHGQVQELDRRLMTSKDSELAYKQHVESLQKNESSLQKKVREYELREIDSQARIRELEQTAEITNDRLATLQRSENKLKYRVQELEGIGGQIPGELTPAQRQKVPQKLEDCQKRVLVLQTQVENLQLQLRQALSVTHKEAHSQEEDNDNNNNVCIEKDDYKDLQTKAALLDETTYQLEQVEKLNEELTAIILQLRRGKGASGHEVEIEVLKRRNASYKTLISKLKSSLPTGQATSLLDPEDESGPTGQTLSAQPLHGLASERVLQSVRRDNYGKADPLKQGSALGLVPIEDEITKSTAVRKVSALPGKMSEDDETDSSGESTAQSSSREESHWRAIEARKPTTPGDSRGGVQPVSGANRTSKSSGPRFNGKASSPVEEEEVTIGLHLPSESELSSYHRTTQNDTDSSNGPVAPPRRGRVTKAVKNINANSESDNTLTSGSESSDGQMAYELSGPALFSANKRLFANEKSLPLKAKKDGSSEHRKLQKQKQQAPLTSFGEDSFYLPSSAQEGDSLEDEDEVPPPLPSSIPPGVQPASNLNFSDDSMGQRQQERRDSLDSSGSGISIRDRIAMIEKQLQSDSGRSDDDQVFYWKKKSSESRQEAESLLKENKHLKEDINRLGKELEEKRRNIHILELWLSNIEDLLKNKNKHTDREMVEQLQVDLTKLRRELTQVGYRSEDAILDPAALKTELERKEREIMSKKTEVEVVSLELKRCRSECDNIEGMRRTALDSLRDLEREIIGLQDNDKTLKETKEQLKQLKAQYDEMENYKNEAVTMIQPLQAQVDKLTRECQEKDALLHRLGEQLRQVTHRPSSALDDLLRLEQMMSSEDNNQKEIQSSRTQPLEKSRVPTRSSSMDDLLDLSSANSDHDSLEGSFPGTPYKKQRPVVHVNNRPRSADILSSAPRTQRGTHAHSRWAPSGQRSREHQQLLSDGVTRGQYVAIADYDPGLFSQSGRPGLELSLREGDQVLISGMMDQCGYYEAVVNGRSGLVPANYLQPLQINGPPVNHLDSNGTHLDHSPEQMMDLYRRLQQQPNYTAPRTQKANFTAPRGYRLNGSTKTSPVLPEPPHHLHIKEILKEKSLLLSWSPPSVDHHGNSNGVKVLGYMVYVDNKEYEQLSGLHQCEVVIEGLSRDTLHCLAVQSLCAEGYASIKAELVFEGVGQQDPQTDLSSVLNSLQYKKGHKRMVMALYDYSPEQQSPNDYTALELAFHAGDVMYVYGEPRQDGFYHGKIDDKKGLVPACFVEDVSNLNKIPGKHKPSSH